MRGKLLGTMKSLGFSFQQEAILQNMTAEIVKSSEIEGVLLNMEQVRSAVSRRLNFSNPSKLQGSHYIDGIVEMLVDATHNCREKLTLERLCGWHAALFPTGRSGLYEITAGRLRDDKNGPMQVVSLHSGREVVHYEAPAAFAMPMNWQAKLCIRPCAGRNSARLRLMTASARLSACYLMALKGNLRSQSGQKFANAPRIRQHAP